MNVLIYNGPGVSKTSLSHTVSTLRTLLLPHYAVQTITPKSLSSDPWHTNCVLFVLPGGRDLPYVSELKQSNEKISRFVREGGAFLGLCAGAYYACRSVEWEVGTEQEVSGARPLHFFNGVGRGCVYPGFQYESEAGARVVSLMVRDLSSGNEEHIEGLYYNGGGEFVGAQNAPGAKVIARYTEGAAEGKIAGVFCEVGRGNAVLWAIHPEYPLTLEPAVSAIRSARPDLEDRIEQLEEKRWVLMRESLSLLGLQLPSAVDIRTMQALPQFLVSTPELAPTIAALVDNLAKELVDSEPIVLKDNIDTFHFHKSPYSGDLFNRVRESQGTITASDNPARSIIVLKNGIIPPLESTPAFNLSIYFSSLKAAQNELGLNSSRPQKTGEVLLYGEVVTSTQTMLDKRVFFAPFMCHI